MRTLPPWFVEVLTAGLLATLVSCGPPEHSSIPGPILVSANDEFIRAHPLLVEISAIGGTVYVRDGGSRSALARTCCRRVVKMKRSS